MNELLDLKELELLSFRSIIGELLGCLGKEDISYLHPTKLWEYPWAVINSGVKTKMKVLDAGCGDSIFPVYLAGHECQVYAADEKVNKEIARIHGLKIDYHEGDIYNLPYEDNFFDRIFCLSVLEHLEPIEVVRSAKELSRVLRPGGLLAITVDFFKDSTTKFTYNIDGEEGIVDWHIFDEKRLYEEIIDPSGLKLYQETDFKEEDWEKRRKEMKEFHPFEYTVAGLILKKDKN